jgi:serine/threonine-protein kinase RsbW
MGAEIHDTLVVPTRLAAIDEARRWASGHARRAAFAEDAIGDLEVAMTEALSNVIVHSYEEREDERVQLSLDIDADRLALGIRDRGRPFDAAAYRPPDLDAPAEHGYGVFLIEQLVDEVVRRPLEDGGTLMQLVRYRTQPEGSDHA